MNQRPGRVAIHFTAQAIDVHIDYIRRRIDAHAPNVIEDHSTRHDASGVAAKILQERELLGSELQDMSAALGLAAHEVEFEVSDVQACGFFLAGAGASEKVAEAGEEFGESKGFGEAELP